MALPDTVARLFLDSRARLAPPPGRDQPRWLSVGTVDYYVTAPLLRRYGIPVPDERAGEDPAAHSKRLMALFAAQLGYPRYEELDINDRADVRFDLNHPLPDELRGEFDLVWDSGSIEHVMNGYRALRNALELVRVGGLLVFTQGIGDQTNAGYWTLSPNLYLGFFRANGLEMVEMLLYDRRGHTKPYEEVATKTSTVGGLIPLRLLPTYYMRMLRHDLSSRLLARGWPTRLLGGAETYAPRLAELARVALGRTASGGPDWSVWVVARKTKELPERFEIQNIYRGWRPQSSISARLQP
jgi:SAM-dependent methyltransferase